MTRRFCDICEKPLKPEDDKPFIRYHSAKAIQISMAITDLHGHVINDICNECKVLTVLEGQDTPNVAASTQPKEFATLQLNRTGSVAAGKPIPLQPATKPEES